MSASEGSYEARRSALPDRVEVRVRSERRRRWSDGDKLAIVRETLAPGAVAQVVADRHGIGTGLLYTWRKQMLWAAMTGFAAVEIRPEALPAPQVADDRAAPVMEVPPKPPTMPDLPSLIEVELPTGVWLRIVRFSSWFTPKRIVRSRPASDPVGVWRRSAPNRQSTVSRVSAVPPSRLNRSERHVNTRICSLFPAWVSTSNIRSIRSASE